MTVAVVVVAAGVGRRLAGIDGPKALVEVAGRPLLSHVLERVRDVDPNRVVVVCTPGYEEVFRNLCQPFAVDVVVPGGASRLDSVRAGLAEVGEAARIVAVHDAARAFTPADVIRRTIAAVEGGAIAAAPGSPVADTVKRVDDEGRVTGTVPREGLWAVQTPQCFARDVLMTALRDPPPGPVTDDLALVEHARAVGRVTGDIVVVAGSRRGHKVTYREDLELVEQFVVSGGEDA